MAGLAKGMNRMAETKRFHAKAAKVAKEKRLKISSAVTDVRRRPGKQTQRR